MPPVTARTHAYPDDLAAFVHARWAEVDAAGPWAEGSFPNEPPPRDVVEALVSTAYQASLLRDEERPVTFRAVLSPFQSGTPFAEAAVNVSEVATTSTTEAWRDFPSTIYLSPAQVAAATQGMRYPTTIASTTSFTTSYACLVCVSVYLSQSVSSEARIGGFYAAEYIA